MRKEKEIVEFSYDGSAKAQSTVLSQERLKPGAGVQHWEELFLEVYDQEFAEEGDVVAAVVAVPDGEEGKGSCTTTKYNQLCF